MVSCTTQTPSALTHRSTPAFSLTQLLKLTLLLAEAESPQFFFQFGCNNPSSLCSSVVCISLYFIHLFFLMYRTSLKLVVSLW
uniref:Uncharacterized protein n=1 Tax=Lynx canadensis TaxID=61383 RepID=A0A667FUF6_LYNCA